MQQHDAAAGGPGRTAATRPTPAAAGVPLDPAEVTAATARIAGLVRPVSVAPAGPLGAGELWFALEYLQHTGSFKARGARNFLLAHAAAGALPDAGVTIASGGNAGLACAWAAREQGVRATVFLPATAPAVKIERLGGYGAEIRLVGSEYAEAAAACHGYAAESGALLSHAYDHPLIAAGAGTLAEELRARLPRLGTVVVAVGGGGLFAGTAAAAHRHGIRTVAVEPHDCRALFAGVRAGHPVDVPVASIAADSLGARRASGTAVATALATGARSELVTDEAIVAARRALWREHRVAVEHGAATAYAAVTAGLLEPEPGEQVCVVLCGANTDPHDLTA